MGKYESEDFHRRPIMTLVSETVNKIHGMEISEESKHNLAELNTRLASGAVAAYTNHIKFSDAVVGIPLILTLPNVKQVVGPVAITHWDFKKDPLSALFFRSLPLVHVYPQPIVRSQDTEIYSDKKAQMAENLDMRTREMMQKPGTIYGITPEGTRNPNATLQIGKPGIGKLEEFAAGISYTPIGFIYKKNSDKPEIIVGRPLTMNEFLPPKVAFSDDPKIRAQQRTDLLMLRLAALLPPQMKGVYADQEKYLQSVGLNGL